MQVTASAGGMGLTSAKELNISTSANNADITLNPYGTGDVKLLSDIVTVGDSAAAATITSNGAGTLTLTTNSGINSGKITMTNGNITLEPNETGIVSVKGNFEVSGKTQILSSTNTVIKDNLIELNNGVTTNTNDSGILIQRGDAGHNAFIGWDESVDKFILGTTTAVNTDTGNLTIANADLQIKGIDSGSDKLTLTTAEYKHNATGAIIIDGKSTLSIDSADNSKLTVDANGKHLDIAVAGGGTQELRLASAGTGTTAIHLNASDGGITNQFAKDKSYTIKNANNDLSILLTDDSNITDNKKIVLTNTQGTDEGAIAITASAGGITMKVADEKNLTMGNADKDAYFKVAASATSGNEYLKIVNTYGTDEAAITLTASAGGVDIDAAKLKMSILLEDKLLWFLKIMLLVQYH